MTFKEELGFLDRILKIVESMLSNNKSLIAVITFLYVLPLFTTTIRSDLRSLLDLLTFIMIFGILALSFELQLGRSGLLNFGQVAFFGVGAYTIAYNQLDRSVLPDLLDDIFTGEIIFSNSMISPIFDLIYSIPALGPLIEDYLLNTYIWAFILAVFLGMLLGCLMGLTTSRLKGTGFAFIALAIAMVIYNYYNENPDISGGETGLSIKSHPLFKSFDTYQYFIILTILSFFLFQIMIFLFFKEKRSISPFLFSKEEKFQRRGPKSNSYVIYAMIIGIIGLLLTLIIPYALAFLSKQDIIPSELNIINNITNMQEIPEYENYFRLIPNRYYFVLSCLVITYIFIKRLTNSQFGRTMAAIAQNEDRAEALGYNVYLCKIIAVGISGGIGALSGALYITYNYTISPENALHVVITIEVMLYAIVGGLGTIFGPLFGAGLVIYSGFKLPEIIDDIGMDLNDILNEWNDWAHNENIPILKDLTSILKELEVTGEWWPIILGIIYVLIVLFFPYGIIGTIKIRSLSIKEKLRLYFRIRESEYWLYALLVSSIILLFMLESQLSLYLFPLVGILILIALNFRPKRHKI